MSTSPTAVREAGPAGSDLALQLRQKIDGRTALVGIVGMGYVGLPLALTFVEQGFPVLGFDVDAAKVTAIGEGLSYLKHMDGSRLTSATRSGRLRATSEFQALGEPDAILICVPTPLTPQREPDMSYVVGTARKVRDHIRRGQLIVLESTTYPGTTDELVRDILEESGLKCGVDFFLAFSPEREDPGNASFGTATIPKVVGGVDEVSGDLAEALYGLAVTRTVRVSSCRTAEATKLTENIFRAVNIALVNELKMVFDRMGIDIWEVLDAASTKPFGFMRFNPGPGWGGHCIPLDPFYLAWKAREYGITPKFIELAGEVNEQMPRYVIEKLQLALNERSKAVKGSRILVLGLAYKKNIDDPRESPAFEIIDHLLELGAVVTYHDPHVPKAPAMRSWPDLPPMSSVPLDASSLGAADAVLIVTDHAQVDYDLVSRHAALVIDTRGVYRENLPNVVKA
ncbi:MAG: nucleotide sugar dehydrogenase [Acidobacteriota bacterium]